MREERLKKSAETNFVWNAAMKCIFCVLFLTIYPFKINISLKKILEDLL